MWFNYDKIKTEIILKYKKVGCFVLIDKYEKDIEYELFSEYKSTRKKELRDEIFEKYLYIARILSKRFINRGIDYDDIYHVAIIGLLGAIERFDPDRNVKFATFATPTILGEIRKYFRDKGNFIKVPRRLYEIFYKAEQYKHTTGIHNIEPSELARALNISEKELEYAYKAGDSAFVESLEYEAYADGNMTLNNVLGIEDNNFIMIEDKDFIESSLKKLSDKEIEFITMRYRHEMTQTEISKKWNTSQMNVSRFEKNILKKLRDMYFHE